MISFVVNILQGIMMFCVLNSFIQKTPPEIRRLLLCYKRFLAVTQKRGKCFFNTLACNKMFSNLGTEINNQRELEKHFKNQILKPNIFTVPGLESEIWQEVRLRPSIHTTCQNLNLKKREWFLILNSIFFGLSSFYSFFHLVYHNRRNFFSKA